jgi:hypothetical protein
MADTVEMRIVVDILDAGAAREAAQEHYEQLGRGDMEANAYMPGGQPLDLPHALLEATLAWLAETDALGLVKTEIRLLEEGERAPDPPSREEPLSDAERAERGPTRAFAEVLAQYERQLQEAAPGSFAEALLAVELLPHLRQLPTALRGEAEQCLREGALEAARWFEDCLRALGCSLEPEG